MQKRREALPRLRLGFPRLGFFEAFAVAVLLITVPMAGAAQAAPDAAIVIDAKTDKALYSSNADAPRHPASLTKMMTLYLLFEAIEKGKTSLDAPITISAHAAAQAPSKLGLLPGQTISVRDAILAIVTKSANDVAVGIAEYVGGSEKNFCNLMTQRAHQMGMTNTTFVNASGLPDSDQITTARDLATLALALREHYPQYYSYFSTPSFVWRGRRITNHDHLLGRVAGVNGIKTGYTQASGFNLATSVDRDNRMIVGIVLGGETVRERDRRMAGLVEKYLPLASRGAQIASIVPGGPRAAPRVRVADAMALPMPRLRPAGSDDDASDDAQAAPTVAAADASPAPTAATATPDAGAEPAPDTTSVASLIGANSPLALEADPQPAPTADAQPSPTKVAAAEPSDSTPEGDATANDESVDADPPADQHSGWRIQIAAAPTQSGAEDMLDRALSKAGKVLAHASPYTEPLKSAKGTIYRARFAGFSNKEAARSACAYLTKRKISCLAISD